MKFYYTRSNWCCGLGEIGNFSGGAEGAHTDGNILDIQDDDKGRWDRGRWDGYFHNRGLLIATTTSSMKTTAARLQKEGFTVLTTFVNPQTGRMITLWGKHINQPE